MLRLKNIIILSAAVLLSVASTDLPLYVHHCFTMERAGLFFECWDGERDVDQATCCTIHSPEKTGDELSAPPCCTEREVAHSGLASYLKNKFENKRILPASIVIAVRAIVATRPVVGGDSSRPGMHEIPAPPVYLSKCEFLI